MNYESELTSGHPNSLGNTIKITKHVIVKKIEFINYNFYLYIYIWHL